MKTLAIIPARGGSKRVPNKNIRPFCGKPLIAWTIESALQSEVIDRVVVSTESPEIARISSDLGAEIPFLRPNELAADNVPTLPVLQYTVNRVWENERWRPECVVTLQPTSPLRRAEHICESLRLFEQDPTADSLVSCVEMPHAFHPNEVMFIDETRALRKWLSETSDPSHRTVGSTTVARNGAAIYITRTEKLLEYILGGRILPYFMNPEDSMDIDTEFDFRHAEYEMQFRLRGANAT